MMNNPINGRCCDCGEVYELDALNLDLRCAACVEQWKIDENNRTIIVHQPKEKM